MHRFLIIIFTISLLFLSACSIQTPHPEEGRWYCEELNITLDFSTYMAETASNDMTIYTPIHIDWGNGIFVYEDREDHRSTPELGEYILKGHFRYKNGIFTVTSFEDEVYMFIRVDSQED